MNALKVRKNLAKKEYHEQVKKDVLKYCKQYLDETEEDMKQIQRLNSVMHVLWVLIALHEEFGFGKKRLQRLWDAFGANGARLDTARQDGVAFTKALMVLEDEIGMDTYIDRSEAQKLERLYERNVKRYGEAAVNPEDYLKKSNDNQGEKQ